jgi:hypothetical protein
LIFLKEFSGLIGHNESALFSTHTTTGSITMNVTEKTIDELVDITFARHTDPREKHYFKESLRNLVRLAKAEQMQEMRMDVARVACPVRSRTSSFVGPE